MSLFDAAERLAAIDRSVIVLEAARCLHSSDRSSACEACFAVCPVHAIMPGKPPTFDAGKCESCMACLPACPVGAYSADDGVSALLNAVAHIEGKVLELVCERHPQPGEGVSEVSVAIQVKGCLAGLGTGTYIALAPFGLERIVVRDDACATCSWGALRCEIGAQVQRTRSLLAAWGKSDSLIVSGMAEKLVERPLWSAGNSPLSRRDLFRMMARQGQVAMARAMENGVRAAGRRPGRDRLRALSGVAHLSAPKAAADVRLGELGFATLSITGACSACGACARGCPTEAIKFEKDEADSRFSLKFSARLCVGCDLCTRVCVPLALTVNHDPAFADVFGPEPAPLVEGELVGCKGCGAPTAKRGDSELCDLCEMRRANPIGIVPPPGFKMGPHGLEREQRSSDRSTAHFLEPGGTAQE